MGNKIPTSRGFKTNLIGQLQSRDDRLNAANLLLAEQNESVLVFNLGTCKQDDVASLELPEIKY